MGDFFEDPPRSQSRRSFDSFYKANLSMVVRILGKIGVHQADIADIAQQVFLKIYKDWEKCEADGLEVSLETICRQQAANHYRLHRNRFEQPEPNVGEEMPSDDEDAQARLEHYELDQIVRRILAGMTPEFRDLLIRREFQKESLESIAAAHNIARNTATSRLAEAKKVFRLRAERMLGDKRSWLLAIPWAIQTHDSNVEYSDEFIAGIHDKVWQSLTHELGFSEEGAAENIVREVDHEPRQTITRRPFARPALGTLANPLIVLGAGILVGVAGSSLWPHASPTIARNMPMLPMIAIERESAKEGAGLTISAIPPKAASVKGSLVPTVDHELRSLQRARTLIAQGNFTEALATLRKHEIDFPRSEQAAIRSHYIALAEEGLRRTAP